MHATGTGSMERALRLTGWMLACWLALVLPAGAAEPAAAAPKDSCVACHSDPAFLVQNKKLYDYYKNWQLSVHRQERVTCVECHGGNARVADKETAHGGSVMRASDPSSPISYQNVPKTCARCHEDVYKNYLQSEHFKHLTKNPDEKQGPNCVTCHGSVNISVLNVGTVRDTCSRCHNDKTGIYPEIPDQAEEVLSKFLSIHRYYRFIATQGNPARIKAIFGTIDPRIKKLSASWHAFDLDKVGKETKELIDYLKAQREQILQETPQKKPAR